nr:MAG TPA: hypothetical protein [Caudoviricetes sp.]
MKTVDYTLIEKYYDERLSKKENLEQLKANGIEVGRASLYNYCKDKGISDRLGDDELKHLIDPMQTVRQNLDLLKGKGYRIGIERVCKVLKELKEQPTYELKEDNMDEKEEGELVLSVSSNRPVKIKITGDNELSITLEDTDKTQIETTTINIYKN